MSVQFWVARGPDSMSHLDRSVPNRAGISPEWAAPRRRWAPFQPRNYRHGPRAEGRFEEEMVSSSISRMLTRMQSDSGQTMVEYGLILALVSVVAILILQLLGTNVQATFSSAASA